MVKAIMHGCNGHMGQVITSICKEDENIEIVAGIDLYDGIQNDYPVFPSLEACDIAADVVIDFCNAKAVDVLRKDRNAGCPLHNRTFGRAVSTCGSSIQKCCCTQIRKYVTWYQYIDGSFEKSNGCVC